jgi:hypothetical protein
MPPLSATLNTFDSFLVLQKKFCRVPRHGARVGYRLSTVQETANQITMTGKASYLFRDFADLNCKNSGDEDCALVSFTNVAATILQFGTTTKAHPYEFEVSFNDNFVFTYDKVDRRVIKGSSSWPYSIDKSNPACGRQYFPPCPE